MDSQLFKLYTDALLDVLRRFGAEPISESQITKLMGWSYLEFSTVMSPLVEAGRVLCDVKIYPGPMENSCWTESFYELACPLERLAAL